MSGNTQPKANLVEIKRALTLFFQPCDIVELRALDVVGKTHAGYFGDFERLSNEAARLSGQAAGVYVVLNQANRDLLARSQNRITIGPKNLTQDADITGRHWLPIDVDAKRPSGLSSTDAEHEAALGTTKAIKAYLIERGFPVDSILTGDSGTGAHILIRVDLPNDAEAEAIVKACLKALAAKFDSSQASIDLSVFNATRIWKLPGEKDRVVRWKVMSFNASLRGCDLEEEKKECIGTEVNSLNSFSSVEPMSLVPDVLGVPVDQALELWRQHGALVIHLSQGVNCLDLGKLLSRRDVSPEHLKAVRAWLQENKGGEQC